MCWAIWIQWLWFRVDFRNVCSRNLQITCYDICWIFKEVFVGEFLLLQFRPSTKQRHPSLLPATTLTSVRVFPSVSSPPCNLILHLLLDHPLLLLPWGGSNSKLAVLYQSNSSAIYVHFTSMFAVLFALLLVPIVHATTDHQFMICTAHPILCGW